MFRIKEVSEQRKTFNFAYEEGWEMGIFVPFGIQTVTNVLFADWEDIWLHMDDIWFFNNLQSQINKLAIFRHFRLGALRIQGIDSLFNRMHINGVKYIMKVTDFWVSWFFLETL